jgi:DNA-binding NarL/FixJ family response regulator
VAEAGRTDPLRVLVVDDHPMLRQVVVGACADSDGIEVVGEASDGEEALAETERLGPDILVLDLVLPKLDGLEVARRLRAQGDGGPRILVLTGRDDPDALFEAVRAGVDGLLDKTSEAQEITDSIYALGDGRRLFTEEQEAKAILKLRELVNRARENSAVSGKLTTRELEVLNLIAEGLTTFQMGKRLGLSARTVESHIARTYRKLNVRTRTEAVAKARRLGLLTE